MVSTFNNGPFNALRSDYKTPWSHATSAALNMQADRWLQQLQLCSLQMGAPENPVTPRIDVLPFCKEDGIEYDIWSLQIFFNSKKKQNGSRN